MTAVAVLASVADTTVDSANRVESAWSKLRGYLLDVASELCTLPRNHNWRPTAWWWNEQVEDAAQEKHAQFKAHNALKEAGDLAEAKEENTAYIDAKYMAKHAICLAKSEADK